MITKGQKISDRYQIIKSIGEGGMANVYLAYDTILDRNVAIKVLRGDLASDEKFVRRFQREALAASSLSHPNIVEVYDVGEDNGEYYIVMEYVEGRHLKSLLKKRGKLTLPEVVDIVLQITSGLSVAHDSYLIHRDIKPQNILILDNGLIKITDFGIAVAMNATQLTQTNSVMGSVHYLPPEQASGKGATLQSDIYSIGILMYELLTGKLPFKGDNAVEIALKHLKEPMPLVKDEIPSIPQSVENIILKATAKNPKNRYVDAREMNEDLKTCLNKERLNEEKISFKYPEQEYDETKMLKVVKEVEKGKHIKEQEKKDKNSNSKENTSQNKILIILGSIFVGLIVIVTSIFVLIPYITKAKQVAIPDVVGKTSKEATEILQNKGFVIADDLIPEPSDKIDEGRITKTSPAAGVKRKEGFEVKLFVSSGNNKIKIEDYTGKNYKTVSGYLTGLGLQVIIEEEDISNEDIDDYEQGVIIRQSVEAGKELNYKDFITLYIPRFDTEYPNFLEEDYTIDDVKDFAADNGLDLVIEEVETNEYPVGTVFYQSRAANSKVVPGVRIRIKVAISTHDEEKDTEGNLE